MLESLFNEVAGLFYGRPPVAIFMSTRKGRIGKRGTKELGKVFQMKDEN